MTDTDTRNQMSTTDWTLTLLGDGVAAVTIPEEAAPLVLDHETGVWVRDWGNADWPSDAEVSAAIAGKVGHAVAAKFFDAGDNLAEGIYHFVPPTGGTMDEAKNRNQALRAATDALRRAAKRHADRE